jgi:hypothetical protein
MENTLHFIHLVLSTWGPKRRRFLPSFEASGGGVKGRPARKADSLTAICEPIV